MSAQRPDLDELEAAVDDLVTLTDGSLYGDEAKDEAMDALLAVVEYISEVVVERPYSMGPPPRADDEDENDRDRKRLHRVLRRLLAPARKIAAAFGADGVSVTVGFPLTVEVTFDFKPTTRQPPRMDPPETVTWDNSAANERPQTGDVT